MNVYISNTNIVELRRLKGSINREVIDDAIVTCTVKTQAGAEVGGVDWPITLAPTLDSPSKGDYVGTIPETAEFTAGTVYIAHIDVDAGPNLKAHWEVSFVARKRG
jgi:hypothetical protein